MRIAGVSIGDTHAGQRNGLIRAGTVLAWGVGSEAEEREIGAEVLSDWSKWLWDDVWLPGIEAARNFAGDDPIILAHSGDAVHGDRFAGKGEKFFYSIHANHQEQIFKEAMRPWQDAKIAAFLLAYGTGSHDYNANSAAQNIATGLANWGWRTVADDHIDIDLNGILFNLAHHGPYVSKIARLRENSARNYVKERIGEALAWDDCYAGLYQRGHVHMPVSASVEVQHGPMQHKSHIIITPPLCGPNGYARQAARSMERVECGLYFWEIIDGKLGEVIPFIRSKSTRRYYQLDRDSSNMAFSNMIADGGHTRKKKKRKQKK
jgi:hypothetical protein